MARTYPVPNYTTTIQLNGTTKRKLSTTSPGTTDSVATVGPPVTLVAPQAYYLSPEAVAVAGTLNAVGIAADKGWGLVPSDPSTLVPLNTDGFSLSAGTFTVQVVASRDTAITSADQVCTFTAILFRANSNATTFAQELGRQASASVTMTTTKTSFPITITTAAGVFAAGEIIWLEVFASTTSTSATGSTANYPTNSTTGVRISATTTSYSTNYNKTLADTSVVSDTIVRRMTQGRVLTDSVINTDDLTRTIRFPRSLIDAVVPITDTVSRLFVANRSLTDTLPVVDTIVRQYRGARVLTDTVPIVDTITRKTTYSRGLLDALSTGGGGTTVNRSILVIES